MASRPQGFGMTADLDAKKAAKYDSGLEKEAAQWIEMLTSLTQGGSNFNEWLKDGVVLCGLINALKPGSVKKVNTSKMAFKQMENISNYLAGCESYGLLKTDSFQTVDLYENQNMVSVVNQIHALGRTAMKNKWAGPVIGVKESHENKREFTEQQLRAGDGVIGLQMGSNKGETQAGMNFGKTRSVND